eukprot:g28147.t1
MANFQCWAAGAFAKQSVRIFLLLCLVVHGNNMSCETGKSPRPTCRGCDCYSDNIHACRAAGCTFQGRCRAKQPLASCQVRMNTSRQPGTPYACTEGMEAARRTLELCNERRRHPFSKYMFQGASDLAEILARHVRQILGVTEEEYPLRFAYYANWLTDSFMECKDAGTGVYQVPGGGTQLCSLLQWNAGMKEI